MWNETTEQMTREFTFPDFKAALVFVNKVGDAAEAANHHPDIELGYGRVKVTLSTHTENKVTNKDRSLAATIDSLL
jgi:4a-hydroxytetrahydrobiopterin dehydratase